MKQLVLACAVIVLAACSSTPPYPNTLDKNVTINLHMDAGGLLTSIEAYAGVNRMRRDCSSEYLGYVELAQGDNAIGLAPGETVFLAVEISRSRWGSGSSMARGSLITPQPGNRYEFEVRYVDRLFDLRLYETGRAGRKALDLVPLAACHPAN